MAAPVDERRSCSIQPTYFKYVSCRKVSCNKTRTGRECGRGPDTTRECVAPMLDKADAHTAPTLLEPNNRHPLPRLVADDAAADRAEAADPNVVDRVAVALQEDGVIQRIDNLLRQRGTM